MGQRTSLPQYDFLRKQASQESNKQRQMGQEALNRRFAALGGVGSGAQIKTEQNLQSELAKQAQGAQNQISFQEQQQIHQEDLAKQEREAQQAFISGESEKAREFQKLESGKQRSFQEKLANMENDYREKVFAMEYGPNGIKFQQLNQAWAGLQMEYDAQEFNKALAAAENGEIDRLIAFYNNGINQSTWDALNAGTPQMYVQSPGLDQLNSQESQKFSNFQNRYRPRGPGSGPLSPVFG